MALTDIHDQKNICRELSTSQFTLQILFSGYLQDRNLRHERVNNHIIN